jgi:hypothetical protein
LYASSGRQDVHHALAESTGWAERDLHPARHLGPCRRILRDHHRHERGSVAHRWCRKLLPPDEELARVQPVAQGHRRDDRGRIERFAS